LALAIDLLFGDPPNRFHPVAWMGKLIARARRLAPRGDHLSEFTFGVFLVGVGALVVSTLGRVVAGFLSRLPRPLGWVAEALALKMTFSLRGLDRAAGQVETALEAGDLPEARRLTSWHLVSRDTSTLTTSQVAAAAIESLAENASDGLVAPLFYYALGGLPLALAYRYINTADSMLGYRDPAHEWLGKAPARLDDLANFLPARLTAGLLALAAFLSGEDGPRALAILRRDARLTDSPNAGCPMSAAAGALGVELEKEGHYRLGEGGAAPTNEDLPRARRLLYVAAALAAAALVLLPSRKRERGGGV
jgi:adenosylcobinamide-phosphate synthase